MSPEQCLDLQYELRYRAEYSTRYHRRRAAFLGNLDTVLTLLTIAAGATTFGELVAGSPGWLSKAGAAAITLMSLAQVILRLGPQAAAHTHWLKRWTEIQTATILTTSPQPEDIRGWTVAATNIETECVGELRALCIDCENVAAQVMKIPNRHRRIQPLQKLFIHLGTWQQVFPNVKDGESPQVLPSS